MSGLVGNSGRHVLSCRGSLVLFYWSLSLVPTAEWCNKNVWLCTCFSGNCLENGRFFPPFLRRGTRDRQKRYIFFSDTSALFLITGP